MVHKALDIARIVYRSRRRPQVIVLVLHRPHRVCVHPLSLPCSVRIAQIAAISRSEFIIIIIIVRIYYRSYYYKTRRRRAGFRCRRSRKTGQRSV